MEISSSDLFKLYSKKRTSELLNILSNKNDYSELAVDVAKDEVMRRGIGEGDVEEFHALKVVQQDEQIKRTYFLELRFIEKLFIYFGVPVLFFGMLLIFAAKSYLQEGGFFMKLHQARLFLIVSFLSLIITMLLLENIDSIFVYCIWVSGFFIALYFDRNAAKKRKADFIKLYGQEHYHDFYGKWLF